MTQLPEDDIVSLSRQEMHARLVVAMGGRAAEEKVGINHDVTLNLIHLATISCLTDFWSRKRDERRL